MVVDARTSYRITLQSWMARGNGKIVMHQIGTNKPSLHASLHQSTCPLASLRARPSETKVRVLMKAPARHNTLFNLIKGVYTIMTYSWNHQADTCIDK